MKFNENNETPWKTMKLDEKQGNSMNLSKKQCISMKNDETLWKTMQLDETPCETMKLHEKQWNPTREN